MKKLVIITGSSHGLGKCLVKSFINLNYLVIGVSRSNTIKHANFYFFKHDLTSKSDVSSKLKSFLVKNKISKKIEEVTLINNAATVLPINYFHKMKLESIQDSYQLNLFAPMMLTHFVINHFQEKASNILICNVSSGAAILPLINWSAYCIMKSGLKMFSDCLNVDYESNPKIKSINFSPGLMETNMQKTIRKQDSKKFKNVLKFRELKQNDKLLPPEFVASKLSGLLISPNDLKKNDYSINEL